MIGIGTKFAPGNQAMAIAWKAGFRRAELWTDAKVLARWQEILKLAKSFPFDFAIHFPNQLDQSTETLDHTIALYRGLNARALIIHQPHLHRHGQALLDRYPSLNLAVENHKLSLEGFHHWAESNPGLTLDIEHLWKYTLDDAPLDVLLSHLKTFLARHVAKLHHIHMPGYLPGQPEHRPFYCSRDMVLDVFDLLATFEFSGLIVSEVNEEFQNPFDLQMDVLLFESWKACRPS